MPTRVPVLRPPPYRRRQHNETVTVSVISTGGFFRGVVYLVDSAPIASNSQAISQHSSRRHQQTRCPVCPVGSALLRSDTVCGGRTRGADGVVYTVNLNGVARQAETPDAIALVTT